MSPTVTVGPRVEFDTEGWVRLRAWDSGQQRERYLYLHRLVAYAEGEIDNLGEPVHIHHRDQDKWNNHPANLEARPPERHTPHHHKEGAD